MSNLKTLSLGAGVQSTALLLASANGLLPKLDAAIFADTGWEPRNVYEHLNRIEQEIATPAGIPIYRVSEGNIRDDALNPDKRRFASMPLFVKSLEGKPGMIRRQCTSEYKIKPIQQKVKEMLGAVRDETGKLGRVKKGLFVEQWIGISTDEFHRAKDSRVRYIKHTFPLLELGWSRSDCVTYLEQFGWGNTPKSACIGCPFHGNRLWRELRDEHPDDFADAVAFDEAIRENVYGGRLLGQAYLHRSMIPLAQAPLDYVSKREASALMRENQRSLFDLDENSVGFSCSPFSCEGDESKYGIEIIQQENSILSNLDGEQE